MSIGLTEIEYFADSLNGRVKQLLKEKVIFYVNRADRNRIFCGLT